MDLSSSTTTNQWSAPLTSQRAVRHVSITTDPQANTLTIPVSEADWEQTQQRSFYQGEQAVQQLVTTVGRSGPIWRLGLPQVNLCVNNIHGHPLSHSWG